ncbi:protein translocase subunit SecDF, partial [Pediococcus acidilactici]
FLILLVYRLMGAVLTLPGIAALVLGVGMAVDANIITYERIKEELRVGKSVKSAFRSGNKSSFVAIFDSNITTILAAIILFYFGTS